MFRLSDQEFLILISQIAISKGGRGGRRKAPFAFTEQEIAMLSPETIPPKRVIGIRVND